MEKNQTNATSVNMPALILVDKRHIWKHAQKKTQNKYNQCDYASIRQTIWGDIWKHTVEKCQINANNVVMHCQRRAIWGHTWKDTMEKNQTETKVTRQTIKGLTSKIHIGGESNKCNWLMREVPKTIVIELTRIAFKQMIIILNVASQC